MIFASPGAIYIAPRPECPQHGPFAWDGDGQAWVCHGFDGEGCPVRLTYEQWRDSQVWEYIGDTDAPVEVEFRLPGEAP